MKFLLLTILLSSCADPRVERLEQEIRATRAEMEALRNETAMLCDAVWEKWLGPLEEPEMPDLPSSEPLCYL